MVLIGAIVSAVSLLLSFTYLVLSSLEERKH